jgi:hypothetical protein
VSDPAVEATSPGRSASDRQDSLNVVLSTLPGRPVVSVALIGVSVLTFLAAIYLAIAHVNDRYGLDQVSGARIALAKYFNSGTLYPKLYDGHFYGGSRFMPLPIILHGLAARVTGEFVASGKVLGYAATLGLVATMLVILRRMRCPTPLALALTAMVLTTRTGLAAMVDLRADMLPLLLQLLAVWIVARTARPAPTVAAAALAALAFMSKLSAVWAPLAIAVWLLGRDRKRFALFSVTWVALGGGLLLLFAGVTDGRIFENVFGLSTSGITGLRSAIAAPYRLLPLMTQQATAAWALLPFLGLAAWFALRDRDASIYLLSLIFAVGVILVVFTDVGTGWNQLVDLVVLGALVSGEFAGRIGDISVRTDGTAAAFLGAALSLAVLWFTFSGLVVSVIPDVKGTLTGELSPRKIPLSGLADSRTKILSEDPYVPISLGQVPIVLDAFMVPRIGRKDPRAVEDLIHRIQAQEFDLVVLVVPLQPLDQSWWREEDFGPNVAKAISAAYVYAGRAQGYYLYRPVSPNT